MFAASGKKQGEREEMTGGHGKKIKVDRLVNLMTNLGVIVAHWIQASSFTPRMRLAPASISSR
jgi:hypothetical protein